MDEVSNILEAVRPAWIVLALIGAAWAGIACVAVPPRGDQFPRILVAALVGAAIGQAASGLILPSAPAIGDVQVVGVSLGSVAALGIVRLFWA